MAFLQHDFTLTSHASSTCCPRFPSRSVDVASITVVYSLAGTIFHKLKLRVSIVCAILCFIYIIILLTVKFYFMFRHFCEFKANLVAYTFVGVNNGVSIPSNYLETNVIHSSAKYPIAVEPSR